MASATLTLWNLLTPSELASMIVGGMLPSEIPAGFERRQRRLMEAYTIIQRTIAESPRPKTVEVPEIALSINPPKKDNSRPVVSNKPAVRWPSEKAAARALKVRRDTLREILRQNDNGKQLVIGGHVLRHADAA